jgi:hypothetical protein
MGKVGPQQKAMKKVERKAWQQKRKRQRRRGYKQMPLKEGLSLRQPGEREPVNNLRPSIRQHLSIAQVFASTASKQAGKKE